jgi:hypothetical protein
MEAHTIAMVLVAVFPEVTQEDVAHGQARKKCNRLD